MKNSPKQFHLSNIDTSFESYQSLINLYSSYKNNFLSEIEISISRWFAANLSSALGGILDKFILNFNSIYFKFYQENIESILKRNSFLSYYGYEKLEDYNNTTIKYLKLKPSDGRYFHNYITNELLKRPELPLMSAPLKKKISESIYEIFVNAQMHSETNFIYTCGQFYPRDQKIEFTITDTGIGFRERINRRFGKNLSSVQALKWAINDGNSTKKDVSGGIGLAILKEFITKNKGKLQIVSDDGFYQYSSNGEATVQFNGSFPGTIVNMQFRTDDVFSYSLASEANTENIF